MKKRHVHHAIIIAGILCSGFAFWYLLAPGGQRPLTVAELRALLIDGPTPQDRAKGAAGLGERGDVPSVPLLLLAMEDDSLILRARAGVAVKKILGADFFFVADDPQEKRDAALARYHALWEAWKTKTNYDGELLSVESMKSEGGD